MKQVKCVVCGIGCEGPDLVFVIVECTQEQYDNGDHYDAAKEWARDNIYDYDAKMVIDEHDPVPMALFDMFEWATSSTIPCIVDSNFQE